MTAAGFIPPFAVHLPNCVTVAFAIAACSRFRTWGLATLCHRLLPDASKEKAPTMVEAFPGERKLEARRIGEWRNDIVPQVAALRKHEKSPLVRRACGKTKRISMGYFLPNRLMRLCLVFPNQARSRRH